ncbi:HpcH/HpaI aldolase/citrate lyase family protein [Bacillus sp. 31A1R]|uniref:HpcH/HpaI aldolase/citrate lyase family protein n=1 Tax=Robertmurraya mangrovi TaxID=3098077 RepID=A0ABU5J1A2_9BACI|nr:HpcH/HpaI aldolase/citrate lyase family protein [Bacillus sp. 31A1R]MDZ5473146.1 HpcH/HpaI aldolase/citrate lyase family protein [Bacillus sp. 31A1R]
MRLFSNLHSHEAEQLFYLQPSTFNKNSSPDLLSYCLGATLYMPATKPNIHQDIISNKHAGLTSLVICLEDAIGDDQVELAEGMLIKELRDLYDGLQKGFIQLEELPLIFIRIRSKEQFERLAFILEETLSVITGIVIPKFSVHTGRPILEQIVELNGRGNNLYAMPILETKSIIYKETRVQELYEIKNLLDQFKDHILNVRIGATDFSGLFGIRRKSDTTVYDIAVIRDCISDIINMFVRFDCPYVVSGPVWEYFSSKERVLKPQIRETPFREKYGQVGVDWRKELIGHQLDGFIKEILMDISNGLVGKTIIHPTHINPVQALNVVTYEEYIDALNIVDQHNGNLGVIKSSFSNKMNEFKPHYYWANKILLKSKVYGVLRDEYTYIDLLKQESYFTHY